MREHGGVITGWGTALPPTVVSNTDLTSILDTSDEWIVERSGVHTRRAATGPFTLNCNPAPQIANSPTLPNGQVGVNYNVQLTTNAVYDAIAPILNTVSPAECANYFANAGYDQT